MAKPSRPPYLWSERIGCKTHDKICFIFCNLRTFQRTAQEHCQIVQNRLQRFQRISTLIWESTAIQSTLEHTLWRYVSEFFGKSKLITTFTAWMSIPLVKRSAIHMKNPLLLERVGCLTFSHSRNWQSQPNSVLIKLRIELAVSPSTCDGMLAYWGLGMPIKSIQQASRQLSSFGNKEASFSSHLLNKTQGGFGFMQAHNALNTSCTKLQGNGWIQWIPEETRFRQAPFLKSWNTLFRCDCSIFAWM
jgi:hypothetical protein